MTGQLTLDDPTRILRKVAGADENVDFDRDILDTAFGDLGYDSLALLETGSRIQHEYDVSLDDSTIADAHTPRALIEAVNARLVVGA